MLPFSPPHEASSATGAPSDSGPYVADDPTALPQSLTDRLLPDVVLRNPDLRRRARLLITSSVSIIVICLLFGIQMTLVGHYPTTSILVMLMGALLTPINLILLRTTGSVTLPGMLFCLEVIVIVAFQAYHDLGLNDPVLLWYMLVPWLASLLVRPIFGFISAGVVIVILSTFYGLETSGHVFPAYSTAEQRLLFFYLQASGLVFCIGFLGWTYEGQTVKNLREANRRLHIARDALQDSNERTESILESITDGFVVISREGRFTYLNKRAEELLQTDRHRLLGSDVWALFEQQLAEDALEEIREVARRRQPTEMEVFYASRDLWLEVRAYPYEDGLSAYLNDVTKRKRYEQRLIEARDTAENLNRLKSNFIASVSHEIRTPLSGIMGFTDVLVEELEGKHEEFARLIHQNAQRLLDTINSVLDMSRLESGLLETTPQPVDVSQVTHDVIALLQPLARERGLYLDLEHTLSEPVAVIDATYLSRVLNNLVGNAIKFTKEGGVTVQLDEDEDHVVLRVRDTGIGISEDFLPHLFEEFRQESSGTSRSHQGSGLGLAITYRLVEALDGAISVESEKGTGSTFTVRLPRHPTGVPVSETS